MAAASTTDIDAVVVKLRSLLSVVDSADPDDVFARFSSIVSGAGIPLAATAEGSGADALTHVHPHAIGEEHVSPSSSLRSLLGVPNEPADSGPEAALRELSSRVRVSLLSAYCKRACTDAAESHILVSSAVRISELTASLDDAWRRYRRSRISWLCGPCDGCGDSCGSAICRYRTFVDRVIVSVSNDIAVIAAPFRRLSDVPTLVADLYGPIHAELLATVVSAYFRRTTTMRPELAELAAEICHRCVMLDTSIGTAMSKKLSEPKPPSSAVSVQSSVGRSSSDTTYNSTTLPGVVSRRGSGNLNVSSCGDVDQSSKGETVAVRSWRDILRVALDPMAPSLADTIRTAFAHSIAKDLADWEAGRGLVRALNCGSLAAFGVMDEGISRMALLESLAQSVTICMPALKIVRALGERQIACSLFCALNDYAAHLQVMSLRSPKHAAFGDAYACVTTAEALSRLAGTLLTRPQQEMLHLLHLRQQGIGGRIHCFPYAMTAALSLSGAAAITLPASLMPTPDTAAVGFGGRPVDLSASLISLRAPTTVQSVRGSVGPHQMHFAQLKAMGVADAEYARLIDCHMASHISSVHQDCDPSQSWRSTRACEYAPPRCPQLALWEMRLRAMRHDAWMSLPSRRAEAILRAVTLCSLAFLQGRHLAVSPSRVRVPQYAEDCACAVATVGTLSWSMGWTLEEWTNDESDARIVRRQRMVLDSGIAPASLESHARHHPADFHAVCSRVVASALVMSAPLSCAAELAERAGVAAAGTSVPQTGAQDKRRVALRRWFVLLHPWITTPEGALLGRLLLVRNCAGFNSRLVLSLLFADCARAADLFLMIPQLDRRAVAAQDAFKVLFTAEPSTSFNLLMHLAAAELRGDTLLSLRPDQSTGVGQWQLPGSSGPGFEGPGSRRWAELVGWELQATPPPAWVAVASRALAPFASACAAAARDGLGSIMSALGLSRSGTDISGTRPYVGEGGSVDVRRMASDLAVVVLEYASGALDALVPRPLVHAVQKAVGVVSGASKGRHVSGPMTSSLETVLVCGLVMRSIAASMRSVACEFPNTAHVIETAFDVICRAVIGLAIVPEQKQLTPGVSLMATEFRCTIAEMLTQEPAIGERFAGAAPPASTTAGRSHRPSLTKGEALAEMASGGISSVDRGIMSIDRYLSVLSESNERVSADAEVLARLRALWDVLRNEDVLVAAARKAKVDLTTVSEIGVATAGPFWPLSAFGSLACMREFARSIAPEDRTVAEWTTLLEDALVIMGEEGVRATLRRRPECDVDSCYPPLSTAERSFAEQLKTCLGSATLGSKSRSGKTFEAPSSLISH